VQNNNFKVQILHFKIALKKRKWYNNDYKVVTIMNKNEKWNIDLSEYIKLGEPDKKEKAENWEIAIGLQDVDGLKPSKYLIDTAKEHIEGNIDITEAKKKIDEYYKVAEERKLKELENNEEADKVAVRITEILSDKSFNFSVIEFSRIHYKLFKGIYKLAGKFRDYNFTKNEWILNYDTVTYSSYESINETLEYDLKEEREFSYKDLSLEESVKHIARFTSNIWQVHPFCEGNTRTTAVFIIKYLRTFGFNINDDVFAENSWYFRNSLVRANYNNYEKNIFEDTSYLEKFFSNLLENTNYKLKNRYTHIDYKKEENKEESINSSNTLEEQAIINLIKENNLITQQEIAIQIGKSIRTVKSIMSKMQEKDIIKRNNGKKDGSWVIL
jgi:fido (protein-threonine AMPylation protein)